ncbi:MAG: D-2-hydroxyacid dehydrogenase [Clostridiales bacterium]|nr:D-2-hydroxyacid dehydrogenase [Clostridiales bacterium]
MNLLFLKSPVFILGEEELALLKGVAPDLQVEQVDARSITDEQLRNADAIFGWPPAERLGIADKLKWLHTPSAGIDTYADASVYANPNVVVTRSKDVFNIQIAEHVIMLFLALNRGLASSILTMQEGKWDRISGQRELSGSTVLIVGAGAIGSELAKRLRGFECKVVGVKRDPSVVPPHFNEVHGDDELDALLPEADYVALCLPRTADTQGMFDYRRLCLMKPDALIANIGRGDAIVMEDVDRALREGKIGGAGLDVTEPEPLPADHPLWGAPNVIITSHTSGNSIHANARRFGVFFDLFKRFAAGEPMHSTVDFDKGY